jgi:hypothetical protein
MLFCFGDSWPAGSELANGGKTFGEILAGSLGDGFANFSQAATSISHLPLQLRRALDQHCITDQDRAVFFLTGASRDLYWQDQREMELHPQRALIPGDKINRFWYKRIHSPELETYRTNTTLMTLHHMCRYHGLRDYYVWGWDRVDLWPELDRSRFCEFSAAEIILEDHRNFDEEDLFRKFRNTPNPFIFPNKHHPNQHGHRVIAEMLYSWIVSLDNQ